MVAVAYTAIAGHCLHRYRYRGTACAPLKISPTTHTHTPSHSFFPSLRPESAICAFVLRGSSGMSRGTRIIRQAFLYAQSIYCRVVVYGGHPRSRRPASPNLAPSRQLCHRRVGREGVVRLVSISGAGRSLQALQCSCGVNTEVPAHLPLRPCRYHEPGCGVRQCTDFFVAGITVGVR